MPKPSPHMRDMRNATAKKAMSQEGVDPDQDLDLDADADIHLGLEGRGSDAGIYGDWDPGKLPSRRQQAAKKALEVEKAKEELYPPWLGREDTGDATDTGDTGEGDAGKGDTGSDTGDTGDTGEGRFGGTFGAERVEAVAAGEGWDQDVTDAVHGYREKLQHEDPGGDGGDYELVEAVGNPPTELIFEGSDGEQYSVEYGTEHREPVPHEHHTPTPAPMMPAMDSLEAIEKIRKGERWPFYRFHQDATEDTGE